MELLFDLLVLPGGPRIRDRLSHGEIPFGLKRGKGRRRNKRKRGDVEGNDEERGDEGETCLGRECGEVEQNSGKGAFEVKRENNSKEEIEKRGNNGGKERR